MGKFNLRELALYVSHHEGLKKEVPIAQISEIIGVLGERWRQMETEEAMTEINAVIKRAGLRSKRR